MAGDIKSGYGRPDTPPPEPVAEEVGDAKEDGAAAGAGRDTRVASTEPATMDIVVQIGKVSHGTSRAPSLPSSLPSLPSLPSLLS